MGLGRHGGGLGAATYLARAGAHLTISDVATAATLDATLARLGASPQIQLHLGGHDPEDFSSAEIVVVNPAVRPDHPCLAIARASGATITSEIEMFLERCPARIIGISGSNGKSTTATMLHEILTRAGRRTWLGGNIGGSLLDRLPQMTSDDWVVLELSSFQLAHLSLQVRLPEIAILTNCSPNHLDWHSDLASYAAAKRRLLLAQQVILNQHDGAVASWSKECGPALVALHAPDRLPRLRVPGKHNRLNAACAATAARAAGIDEATIHDALAAFGGLEHRIEWVGAFRARHFFNDSKSTSPSATLAALAAMERPTWLLLGGVSKGADFTALAAQVARQARGVAVFGQVREPLSAALRKASAVVPVARRETLAEALNWCLARSEPEEAILLSPACASFDQYADFAARGRHFRQLSRALSEPAGGPAPAGATLL